MDGKKGMRVADEGNKSLTDYMLALITSCIPVPVAPRIPHFFLEDEETMFGDMFGGLGFGLMGAAILVRVTRSRNFKFLATAVRKFRSGLYVQNLRSSGS